MKFILIFSQSIREALSWCTKSKKPNIVIGLLLLFLLGCQERPVRIENLTIGSDYKTLYSTPIKAQEVLSGNVELLLQNNQLFCIDYGQEKQILHFKIRDAKAILVSQAAPLGKGPGEFGYVSGLNAIRNKYYFFDNMHKKLYWMKDSTYSLLADLSGFTETITAVCLLEANRLLAMGLFEDSRFKLINKEGETLSTYTDFPCEQNTNMPIYLKNMGFINTMDSDGTAICNVVYDSGIIEFYRFKNKTIELISRKIYTETRFEAQTLEGGTIVKHAESNTGFLDIQISQGLCYALYSATSWKENSDRAAFAHWLLVYNLEGKHLETYFLEEAINQFAIDDKQIIGMGSIKGVPKLLEYKI